MTDAGEGQAACGDRRRRAVAEQKYPAARKAGQRALGPPSPIVDAGWVGGGAVEPARGRRCRSGRPLGRPRARAGAAEPDPRRLGDVRLRGRVRRRRRRRSARRDLLQGHDAQGADRQPDAARNRDAGRDAQLDRAPEPGRRRRHREVRRDLDRRGSVPVIVNVAGESVHDYVEVARRLDGVPGVAGIELNISCPNVGRGRAPVRDRRRRRRPRSPRPSGARPTCRCSSSCRRTSPTSGRSRGPSPTPAPTR